MVKVENNLIKMKINKLLLFEINKIVIIYFLAIHG